MAFRRTPPPEPAPAPEVEPVPVADEPPAKPEALHEGAHADPLYWPERTTPDHKLPAVLAHTGPMDDYYRRLGYVAEDELPPGLTVDPPPPEPLPPVEPEPEPEPEPDPEA